MFDHFVSAMATATREDGEVDPEALIGFLSECYLSACADIEYQASCIGTALDSIDHGLCFFAPDATLILCNRRFAEMFDLAPEQTVRGSLLDAIARPASPAATRPKRHEAGTSPPDSTTTVLANGRSILTRVTPLLDGGWVASHEDITGRLDTEHRLEDLTHYHVVTGLPNQTLLAAQMQTLLTQSADSASCAVVSVSLDDFAGVNDIFGRDGGDALLRIIGARLRQTLSPRDLVAQIGANEFIIVRCGFAGVASIRALAEHVLDLVAEPAMLGTQRMVVSGSAGIAIAFAAGLDTGMLLRNASIARHRAEAEGRGHICLFEPRMEDQIQEKRLLEIDLRDAVSRMAFELRYQPEVDVQTRQVVAFEALLRWHHPVRGWVAPGAFIPLAEEIGLIGRIGEWALERACTDAAQWREAIAVAVNVSALQFTDGTLPDVVAAVLRRTGLQPARLELEITESCIMTNARAAAAMLRRLREAGMRIAMDDFGTGYSSLSALPSLPFDKLKIDQSFVAKLGEGPAHVAIVRAVISLCANLGATCIAEGVETEKQLAVLTQEGCQVVQGYLLGRPCTAAEIPALLQGFPAREPENGSASRQPRVPLLAADWPGISFAEIVNNATDVIMVTDAQLAPPGPRMVYVNRAFTRLTGFELHEALGQTPRMLQGPGTDRAALDAIAAGLRAGQAVEQRVLNYAKNGQPYWLDMRILPLRNAMGQITQFVAIAREVQQDERRQEALDGATAAAR